MILYFSYNTPDLVQKEDGAIGVIKNTESEYASIRLAIEGLGLFGENCEPRWTANLTYEYGSNLLRLRVL